MAAIRSARQQPTNVGKDREIAVFPLTQSRHRNGMIPDTVPDINSCSLNNGSCNNSAESISRKNIAPLSLKSGNVDLLEKEKPKKLDRSQFSEEELAFIDLYNQICLSSDLGFLPITRRSEELDKVLDVFAPDFNEKEWTENFRDAVEQRREVFRTSPGKYNTLVQICWKLN